MSHLGTTSRSKPVLADDRYLEPRVTLALILAVPVGAVSAWLLTGPILAAAVSGPLSLLGVPAVAAAWGLLCYLVSRRVDDDADRAGEAGLSGASVVLGAWLMTVISVLG